MEQGGGRGPTTLQMQTPPFHTHHNLAMPAPLCQDLAGRADIKQPRHHHLTSPAAATTCPS